MTGSLDIIRSPTVEWRETLSIILNEHDDGVFKHVLKGESENAAVGLLGNTAVLESGVLDAEVEGVPRNWNQ